MSYLRQLREEKSLVVAYVYKGKHLYIMSSIHMVLKAHKMYIFTVVFTFKGRAQRLNMQMTIPI